MDDLWAFVAVVSVEGTRTTTLSSLILQIEGSRPRTSGGTRGSQSLELGVKTSEGAPQPEQVTSQRPNHFRPIYDLHVGMRTHA